MSEKEIQVIIDRDLEDLIPGFMENRKADVVKMREALAQQDFESLRSTGHSLKGVGGGYGFAFISEIGAVIESAAKINDMETITSSIDKLENYLVNVRISFE